MSPSLHLRASALLVFAASATLPSTSRAQDAPQESTRLSPAEPSEKREETRTAPNSVFLEVGGPGIVYSVNYDRMLSEMFSLRVGATYFQFHELYDDHAGYVFVPMVANLLLGSANHKFEGGLGVVPGWAFPIKAGDFSGFQMNAVALAGYRYAPTAGGLTFRANVEVIRLKSGFLPWAGVSVGYGF